jgi:molecular chaperone GrpE
MIPEEKDKEKETNTQVENNSEGEKQEEKELPVPELSETQVLQNEVTELKDKFLRLYSEFENFRRRTVKEKMEFFKTANEEMLVSLLPIVDDFERAMKSFNATKEVEPIKEGINLIHNKLYKTLESKGLKPMDSVGKEFNSELHEAISQVPASSEEMKGKVVDEVEKGYYLNDKVIRFAKVIIGS